MKDTLQPGAKAKFAYRVPADKTVPHLYPEALEFAMMPTVFATGFMVGLMEWTCMKVLEPHLDPGEGSLGVQINVSHVAATVPGQTVTVEAASRRGGGGCGGLWRPIAPASGAGPPPPPGAPTTAST